MTIGVAHSSTLLSSFVVYSHRYEPVFLSPYHREEKQDFLSGGKNRVMVHDVPTVYRVIPYDLITLFLVPYLYILSRHNISGGGESYGDDTTPLSWFFTYFLRTLMGAISPGVSLLFKSREEKFYSNIE